MAKSIRLIKQSTVFLPEQSSYKLELQAVDAQNMTNKIFVNQRTRSFSKDTLEDVFCAIATPTQLEDFAEDSPNEGTSFFRTNRIELVARTPEMLQDVFESILYEVKKLVVDLDALDNLEDAQVFLINSTEPITIIS